MPFWGSNWDLGRIPAPTLALLQEGLPIDESAVLQLAKLPALHGDPFDRMLVCQAIEGGLAIVTPDPLIR